uniref:Major facilitator superfamily (MFS) profile domain-containing protein n=1 Tax=Timema monikensis TaxID=170555 RepID=A0A7R9HI21_9NEOP|nr:unnamed protein product [Timema monikensis]
MSIYSINNDMINSDEELLIAPNSTENEAVADTKNCCKTRHVLALMGFLGIANVYAMRVNLSVAIVTMVNNSAIPQVNPTANESNVCLAPILNSTAPQPDGEFAWDEKTQGLILGCFFYGYVLTQVPGGRLAELFGGKLVFGLGILITGIFTALSPLAAKLDTWLFVALRIIEGLGEGVTFPAMHSMLAVWVPPLDRAKFASYVYAGSNFGTIISMPLSGYLCSLDFLGGWPLSFYLFGGLSVLWFVVWLFVVYDTPESNPYITTEEKVYIQTMTGQYDHTPRRNIPWKSLATSLPLWAILVTNCGQSWAFYTQLIELPTYMKNILHFDIEQNSLLTSLPYLTSVVPSLGFIAVALVGCNREAVTLLLVVTGAFGGAVYAGNQMNHMALSPHYAGTMYGITNAASNMCGFLAPYAIGLLINGRVRTYFNVYLFEETLDQWQKVFYIAAAVNIAGSIFYALFASATEQPWSYQSQEDKKIDTRSEHDIEPELCEFV